MGTELPPPIPVLPAPPGDPAGLTELAGVAGDAAVGLGQTRARIARTVRVLRAGWLAGPGRQAAMEAVAEHARTVGVRAVACALANAGLRRYARTMTSLSARHVQLRDDVATWHQDLAIATSHCAAGSVPAHLRDQVRRLHSRRARLLACHQQLHAAAAAAAERAAAVFTRAAALTTADLARLDVLAGRGHAAGHALAVAFPDHVTPDHVTPGDAPGRRPHLDRRVPTPDEPRYTHGPYRPGTGAVVPLMPCPYPKGGSPGRLLGGARDG